MSPALGFACVARGTVPLGRRPGPSDSPARLRASRLEQGGPASRGRIGLEGGSPALGGRAERATAARPRVRSRWLAVPPLHRPNLWHGPSEGRGGLRQLWASDRAALSLPPLRG